MSRIGKKPVTVPAGVTVTIDGGHVSVKGSKGELERTFSDLVTIRQEGEEICVVRNDETTESNAQQGLTRTLINNMVLGVSEGFEKKLELAGVGYRVALKGRDLDLSLGYSHPVAYACPDNGEGHLQGAGGSGGRRGARQEAARAVQGQGHPLRGRAHPQEARQGRQVSLTSPEERPSPRQVMA